MMDRVDREWQFALAASLVLFLGLAGCKHQAVDFNGALPPGQVALRKISPAEYPDFSKCTWNLTALGPAIDHSIEYMNHPGSQRGYPYLDITHDRAMATLKAFRDVVAAAQTRPDAGPYIDAQIRTNFEVYKSVGAPKPDGPGFTERVLFTGYFTPIYDASLTKNGPYQWPVYKRPKGLATDPVSGETAPYLTRQQIESGNQLAGQELVWLKTRWEAYVITVQGSARLKLPDGRMYEIGFAGYNGYEYTSPGKAMVADGLITPAQLNIRALGDYFAAHPDAADKYLSMNQRTVFFTETHGGPYGALNQPVTTVATIATDKTLDKTVNMTVYPRAMPAFLNVPIPHMDEPDKLWQFQGFMMDQDTGGAIRAAGRCDIYMGIGPDGEKLAGRQLNEGELYYIAIKPEFMSNYGLASNAPPGTPLGMPSVLGESK